MRNDLGESLQYMIHHASTLKKFTIRLTTKSVALYPEPIRAVCVYDEEAGETGEKIVFITNNFDISASEVSCLYRHRWDIEVSSNGSSRIS